MRILKKLFLSLTALAMLFTGTAFSAEADITGTESPAVSFSGGSLLAETVDGNTHISVYENTKPEDFSDFCTVLEENGYTLKYNYEPDYGKYAAYENESEYYYFYYTVNNAETRVIRCENGVLPEFEEKYTTRWEEDDSYFTPVVKKTDAVAEQGVKPQVIQLDVLYSEDNHGMCYIIMLSDGSFVLIDGGNNWEPQHVHIWNALNELNQREDGKIVISAWIFTHAHADHTRSFVAFSTEYGAQCELGSVIFNGIKGLSGSFPDDLSEYLQYFAGEPKFIIPHAGQRIAIDNSVIEIISTHEDIFPVNFDDFNDTSIIFRVHIGGQKVMFVGDAQELAGNTAIEYMKGYLAADIVQVSHHGYGDIGYAFYKEVGACVGLWPHEISYYEQYSRESTGEVDRTQFWSEKNMIYYSISHIEVADPYASVYTLPFDFKYDEVAHLDIP